MVRILDIEMDEILTAAFHDPRSWFHGQKVTGRRQDRNIDSSSILTRPNKALYLTESFDRGRAYLVLTIAVSTVLVFGLAAGIACHSVEVGLAVSGTLSAWLSCVEALLLKQYT